MKLNISFIIFLALFTIFSPLTLQAKGNTTNESFNKAKRMLEQEVYFDHRITIYCEAVFDEQKNIKLPTGFETPAHPKRSTKVEWEHAVPVENFGRAFQEWRNGSLECVDNKGKAFRGRKCAEKVNTEFRQMQADMYNLFPAIGSVNAVRSNYQYSELSENAMTFGSCPAKVNDKRFEPPDVAKGQLARAALYMEDNYPNYRISRQQKRLLIAWDKMYPVDQWECTRGARIEKLQGNCNRFIKSRCIDAKLKY